MNQGELSQSSFISSLNLSSSDQHILREAISSFTQATQTNPNDSGVYVQLGLSLYHRCYPETAIVAYNHAISLDSDHAPVYSHLGDALSEAGRLDEAINAYKTAIDLDPLFLAAYVNLASALYSCSRMDEALVAGRKALQIDSEAFSAHVVLCEILLTQSKTEEAKEEISVVRRLWTGIEDMRNLFGVGLHQAGKATEAAEAYESSSKMIYKYFVCSLSIGATMSEDEQSTVVKGCEA